MNNNNSAKQEDTIANTKKFVKNLDNLLGCDDPQLYVKINKQNIDQMIQQFSLVNDNAQHFSIFCSVEDFRKFAPGVYLMFKLLKYLIIMFGVISAISIFQLLLLLKSPFYKGHQQIVRINLLRITLASLQPEDYNVYIGFDILITVIVLGFYIYWSQRMRHFSKKCNSNNMLPSYLTVQLAKVDHNFNESALRNYLKVVQGIQPHQIYTGRNYGQFLSHYAQLTDSALNLRTNMSLYLQMQQFVQKAELAYPIINNFIKLKQKFCSIKSQKFNQKKYEPKQVFIVLRSYYDRQKILRNSTNILSICQKKSQQKKQTNQFHFKPCQVQPQAIAWENLGISFQNYLIRALLVFLLLSVVTFLGIILIFMLQILQTASIGDAYSFHEQRLRQNSNEILQNICQSQTNSQKCFNQINYSKLTLLIILTPLTIFVCKKIIMGILSYFVQFRKYPSQISKIKSQTITLTVFYFTVIAVLHLFLYLKLGRQGEQTTSLFQILRPFIVKMFNITNYSPASIHLYSDYSLDWYKQATFFIVVIGSTSFNLSNGFKFVLNFVHFNVSKWKARKQNTIFAVKKHLHGIQLHMQHVYASAIVINYFALLYNCPIPLVVCFGFINLLILYFLTKLTFIRYGAKPLRLGHSINRTVINMLMIGIIIHCIMAPIFLCAEGIGKNTSHFSYKNEHHEDSHSVEQSLTISERYQKLGPFYLTIASIAICYVLLRKAIIRRILWKIRQKVFAKNKMSSVCEQMEHFGLYPSYSMHNSLKYAEIMKNIYLLNRKQAKRATCPVPRSLMEINQMESYDLGQTTIFLKIVEINDEYLDSKKYSKLYKKVEQMKQIAKQMNQDQLNELQSDKLSDDRIDLGHEKTDQIKEQQ